MKRNALVVVAVAGAAVALIAAVSVAGATSASEAAKTNVTIAGWDSGLLGTVTSNATRCANNRNVKVFRQRGDQQDPKSDKVIGTATARERHRVYQWSLNKGTSGKFYAKAVKRQGCRPAFSETYTVQPHGAIPLCPSHEQVCQLGQLDITLKAIEEPPLPCPAGFADGGLGLCGGTALPHRGWGGVPDSVSFTWVTIGQTNSVTYGSLGYSSREPFGGGLNGLVPVGTKAFYVYSALGGGNDFVNDEWYTPSTAGVAPGEQGGPLYLDFKPGQVVIRGYLYHR